MLRPAVHARLLIDSPADGSWNMAVDQALVESAAQSGEMVLRFYQWAEPTLSLGYFQPRAAGAERPLIRQMAVVRRASGGGAILHDRELTYSLAVPVDFCFAQGAGTSDAASLYRAAHESLIEALAELGITAALCTNPRPFAAQAARFLCFERRCDGDVLLQGTKIAGSAQRRYRRAVLQHGSVLLAASTAAPELAGIAELASVAISPDRLIRHWLPHLAARLGVAWSRSELTANELARADQLQLGRYRTPEWTHQK